MFHCTCGGQKITHDSLYHMNPGIEPRSSGMTAITFPCWTISLALNPIFNDKVESLRKYISYPSTHPWLRISGQEWPRVFLFLSLPQCKLQEWNLSRKHTQPLIKISNNEYVPVAIQKIDDTGCFSREYFITRSVTLSKQDALWITASSSGWWGQSFLPACLPPRDARETVDSGW